MLKRWIGVDFDHVLVYSRDDERPIMAMVERVRAWLAQGTEVRIITARVNSVDYDMVERSLEYVRIEKWCIQYFGKSLKVQQCKSKGMIEFWDDKTVRMEPDTGRRLSPSFVEKDGSKCILCGVET